MREHDWQYGHATGVRTCRRCGLLPLDDEDIASPCGPSFADEVMEVAFRHYLTASLWTGYYESAESWEEAQPEPLDEHVGSVDDIPHDVWDELRAEWVDFVTANEGDILEFMRKTGRPLYLVAHDFHLTRNGHGAGFWDRGAGDVGDRLTDASKPYGTAELVGYPGEDGSVSIYVSN